jgi:hypothetical protein
MLERLALHAPCHKRCELLTLGLGERSARVGSQLGARLLSDLGKKPSRLLMGPPVDGLKMLGRPAQRLMHGTSSRKLQIL